MKAHPLKAERETRGWSQARVAEAVGTNVRTVIRWEQGHSVPYPYHRELLCQLFAKNASELGLVEASIADGQVLVEAEASKPVPLNPDAPLFDPTIPMTLGTSGKLTGRDYLLSQIKQRLWEGGNFALTALQGLPGMGKTALAVALASDETIRERFRAGMLWAGLGREPDVLGHLTRWGKLLGVAPAEVEDVQSREAWGRALRAAIGQRRLLLVVDDAWNIEDALAFQVGGTQCAHLLTTRLPQVAFAFARDGTLAVTELKDEDGLDLLARFVPQLVQQEPERIRVLVQAVGNLPLALTLMGKYLAAQAFTGQSRRLRSALTRLHDAEERLRLSLPQVPGERSPGLPANAPLSLRAAIAVSDQHLSPQAHESLCALALFPPKPNSFSEEAALAVSASALETLDELWDAGLLESHGSGRYTLHQTIADYAREQLKDLAPQQRLVRYITWYIQAHTQRYEDLELELSNLLAGLTLATEQDVTLAVLTMVPFMRVRGHYTLAHRLLQQALPGTADEQYAREQVSILQHLATFAELRGEYTVAEEYCQQGLQLLRQSTGAAEVESALLATLGLVAFQRDYAEAYQLFEQALKLARAEGKPEQICMQLAQLGRIAHHQGKHTQAIALYTEGLALAQQLQQRELICLLFTTLGAVMLEEGDYRLAEEYYQEGVKLARELGYRKQLGALLNDLGVLADRRGQKELALKYAQEGLELARQIGMRADIALCLCNIGAMAAEQQDYALAQRYLDEGIALARQLDNRNNLALLLSNYGYVLSEQGNYTQAYTYFQESLGLARSLGSPWYINNVLLELGNMHLNAQQLKEAEAAFQEIVATRHDAECEPVMLAMAYYGLARAAAQQSQASEARQFGQESLAIFVTIHHYKANEVSGWLQSLPDSAH